MHVTRRSITIGMDGSIADTQHSLTQLRLVFAAAEARCYAAVNLRRRLHAELARAQDPITSTNPETANSANPPYQANPENPA